MSAKPKLLYILAPSYSGSTLLTYLLGRHPKIATIGELKATNKADMTTYRCSCGDLILECGFWRRVQERCAERGIAFSVTEFHTMLSEGRRLGARLIRTRVRGPLFEHLRSLAIAGMPRVSERLRARIERNLALMNVITELQHGEMFLDGSKDAARLRHFIESGLWDVRVIYLQRDGRGLITSIMKYLGISFDEAAEEWACDAHELEHMRARLPGHCVIDLKYEDLCRDPEGYLSRILTWLGLSEDAADTGEIDKSELHVLGNNAMRLGSINQIRLDEKWRSKLSDREQAEFLRRFGDIHRHLGYAS